MSGSAITPSTESLENLLHEKARALVTALGRGDLPGAMTLINELQDARHSVFYREVGLLTRKLHEAIKSFSSEIGVPPAQQGQLAAVADASERLDHVIRLTERAAHDTLDSVERSLALVDRVGTHRGEVAGIAPQLEQLRGELSAILVGQEYQDITGQLIRRVIELLTEVERQLVDLMEMAAKVDRLNSVQLAQIAALTAPAADPLRAEGPRIGDGGDAAVARNQDEVDELLSSLGF